MIGFPAKAGTNGTNGTNGAAGAGAVPIARVFARNSSGQDTLTTPAVLGGWTEVTDLGAQFDASTGIFTATAAGWYHIAMTCRVNGGASWGALTLRVNGTDYLAKYTTGDYASTIETWLQLAASDTLAVHVQSSDVLITDIKQNWISITGIAT